MTTPADWDYVHPWYHGSQQPLTTLRVGSSITQNVDVARAFSHSPSLVAQPGKRDMKHDGEIPGYLYVVAEEVSSADVFPHPHPVNADYWEWLIVRELRVTLLERTQVRDEERLTTKEIEELRRRQSEAGTTSSIVLYGDTAPY